MSDPSHIKGTSEPPAGARLTPYELVFSAERFEAVVFPTITTEAQERGVDPTHPDGFQLLAATGNAVRDVIPEDAPPEAFEQYRILLYHAFNFWRFGRRVYLIEPAVARFLVEAAPRLVDWELVSPHPSLYLQLPANLFWGSVSPGTTPEPVDGLFLTWTHAEDALGKPFARLSVLVVLGIRRERAGFSVIPIETETGPGIAAVWAAGSARDSGANFQNVLPGGDIAGLYSILTTDEVLMLLGRALWYVDQNPGDARLETASEPRVGERAGGLPLSRLPYVRVTLGNGEPVQP